MSEEQRKPNNHHHRNRIRPHSPTTSSPRRGAPRIPHQLRSAQELVLVNKELLHRLLEEILLKRGDLTDMFETLSSDSNLIRRVVHQSAESPVFDQSVVDLIQSRGRAQTTD